MNKNLTRIAMIATLALPLTLGLASAAGTANQTQQNQTQPQRVQPRQPGQKNNQGTQQGNQNQGRPDQNARPGQGDQRGDRQERGGGMRTVHAAVAKALGLTEDQLFTELRSGKTIAQIAQAKGVSTATIRSAALTALKTDLSAAVKDGRLTQAQADEMLSRAQADTQFGLQAGRGKDGRGGKGGPRGGQQDGGQKDRQAPAPGTTRG